MSLSTWQTVKKPINDLIVQASTIETPDGWQSWPIGMSWQYAQNYTKGDSLQLGLHEYLAFVAVNSGTDHSRRSSSDMNRKKIVETLSKNGFQNTLVESSSYYAMLPFYKFVVSPEGNGIDCHRHYEALLAGCIPILEKNPLAEEKYKGCPILWTTDYSEITAEYLEKVYTEMLEKSYDFSCLFLSNYSPEQQAEIKRCGNYWVQRTTQTTWYNDEKKL
jgi:hypothetical protein